MADEKLMINTERLSKLFGTSAQWVRTLTKQGVLTRAIGKDGKPVMGRYSLYEVVPQYVSHLKLKNSDEDAPSSELQAEVIALKRAKRRQEEMKADVMAGKLHRAEDVEAVMGDMLGSFKAKLLAMPNELAPRIEGIDSAAGIMKILADAVDGVLEELSGYNADDFYARNKDVIMTEDKDDSTDEID